MPELPKISLCITTMNKYKDFLSKYLYKFLEYDIFTEVIIVDENGLDKYQIDQAFPNHPKLKTYTNDMRLHAFKNKLKAISLAENDWVFLLDGDNFIGPDFVKALRAFGESTELDPRRIYSPEIALVNWKPTPMTNFNYLTNTVLSKDVIKRLCIQDYSRMEFFMNMGNFLLHKSVLDYDYPFWEKQIDICKCYDTIFFLFMMVYRKDMALQVVPGLRFVYTANEDTYYYMNHKLKEVQDLYKDILHLIANE